MRLNGNKFFNCLFFKRSDEKYKVINSEQPRIKKKKKEKKKKK